MEARLQDRDCAPFFQGASLSVSTSGFFAGVYTLCLKNYVEVEDCIRDRSKFCTQLQRVFPCDKFGPSKRARNPFVLIAGCGEEGSVLRMPGVLLLFHPNAGTDSRGTEYAFLQYTECASAVDVVGKELGCACLRWSTPDANDESAVAGEKLSNRTDLSVSVWSGVYFFSPIIRVVQVMLGS